MQPQLLYNGSRLSSLCFKLVISCSQSFFFNQSKFPWLNNVDISEQEFDLDIKRQRRKMFANADIILRKFSKCSINVKYYLFKTYCSNLYCAAL